MIQDSGRPLAASSPMQDRNLTGVAYVELRVGHLLSIGRRQAIGESAASVAAVWWQFQRLSAW
jgi:hypothetical protein